MAFDYSAAIQARPSTQDAARYYGSFRYREHPTERGRVIPDAEWARKNLTTLDLRAYRGFPKCGGKPSTSITIHQKVAPVFDACMTEAAEAGLLSRLKEYNGCYVARHMGWNPKRPLSIHSWAAAVDWDASTNGYGSRTMLIDRDFVRLMEERGWSWGGRWTGAYQDGMHFEWIDPLPGVALPEWQDKLAKVKKALPTSPRRVLIDGKPFPQGRIVYHGVTIAVLEDGQVYLRPATAGELSGNVVQPPAPTGISPTVTLLDQSNVWVPFSGRAIYKGLMLNLDSKTGDLWIRQARPEELSRKPA